MYSKEVYIESIHVLSSIKVFALYSSSERAQSTRLIGLQLKLEGHRIHGEISDAAMC